MTNLREQVPAPGTPDLLHAAASSSQEAPDIVCPCVERVADAITFTCLACSHRLGPGHRFARWLVRIGASDLRPRPLWERGRGEQHTPAGRIDADDCPHGGGRGVTSRNPSVPPAS